MRDLTKKQEKLIKDWFNSLTKAEQEKADVNFLPDEVWEKLEEINDFETLWQAVNDFIQQLILEGIE